MDNLSWRPNRCIAASHVGAAFLTHVARSGRLAAALRAKTLQERLNSVKKVANFEIAALFLSPCS